MILHEIESHTRTHSHTHTHTHTHTPTYNMITTTKHIKYVYMYMYIIMQTNQHSSYPSKLEGLAAALPELPPFLRNTWRARLLPLSGLSFTLTNIINTHTLILVIHVVT